VPGAAPTGSGEAISGHGRRCPGVAAAEAGSGRGQRRPGAEATTACRHLARVGILKRDRGGKKKEVQTVSKAKYIHRLTDKYTWVVPRGPCRVYSLVTDEYMRQIHRLTNEYTWQGHISPAHDLFVD
jgi:hypothetical protein